MKIRSPKIRLTLIGACVFLLAWGLYWFFGSIGQITHKPTNRLAVQGARLVDEAVLGQNSKSVIKTKNNPKAQDVGDLSANLVDSPAAVGKTNDADMDKFPARMSSGQKQAILDDLRVLPEGLDSQASTKSSLARVTPRSSNDTSSKDAIKSPDAVPAATPKEKLVQATMPVIVPPTHPQPQKSILGSVLTTAKVNLAVSSTDEFFTLIHGEEASKVHASIHESLVSMPAEIPHETYIFSTEK
jgi:hypothetical protein